MFENTPAEALKQLEDNADVSGCIWPWTLVGRKTDNRGLVCFIYNDLSRGWVGGPLTRPALSDPPSLPLPPTDFVTPAAARTKKAKASDEQQTVLQACVAECPHHFVGSLSRLGT